MKKFFLVLLVFISFLGGCNFWWQNKFFDVSTVVFYVYQDVDDYENSRVALEMIPDYQERTLAVKLMKAPSSSAADADFTEIEKGVIGGSNFDDFEELLELLDEMESDVIVDEPMFSLIVESVEKGKKTYNWDDKLDKNGARFYEFYTFLSGFFAEDVY